MSRSSVPFHVQHLASPDRIERILSIAPDAEPFDAASIRSHLLQDSYSVTLDATRRSLDMGAKLGLFQKQDRSAYTLTMRGQACQNLAQFRREVYCDVMHFLLYATWDLSKQRDYWSWSYAKVCEIFWRDKPRLENRKAIFGRLSSEASRRFPGLDPVVGTETVGAVSNWLKELSPPFFSLEDGKLAKSHEREWFSAELTLLAVSYLYVVRDAATQTPILLDQPTLELLCPLCLTSAERIAAMIDIASRTFSFLDIHTGEWGSSVVLSQIIDIPLLA